MDSQRSASRARIQMQGRVSPLFSMDTAAASVLSAWENSQRHYPIHRPQPAAYNNFPISPVSPSSSPSSSAQSMLSATGNTWAPSTYCASAAELEIYELRRGMIPPRPDAALLAGHGHEPRLPGMGMPAANHFEFDFSLPHLPHLSLQLPHSNTLNNAHLCLSPPLPTPNTPSSSSTLSTSPPVTPSNTNSNSNMSYRRDSPSSTSSSGAKRSSDDDFPSTTTTAKKPRSCMSVKDFVPPDVTGLSKREARLVKNRAAAFLSRQRKREEFEMMEIRVAELERENSRLREVAEGSSPAPTSSAESSELEFLRMQLAASRQREAELVHRLEVLKHETQKIKTEAISEPNLMNDGESSASNSPLMSAADGSSSLNLKSLIANPKGSASLGLVVLLCALPSLLSQPSSHPRSTLPTSQSFLDTIQWDAPSIFQTSASATIDDVPSWELDFSGATSTSASANMDMDVDFGNVHSTNEEEEPEWKKLDLGLEGGEDLGLPGLGLGALDISFATRRTKDGKIRVRVHSPSSSATSSSTSTSVPHLKTEDVPPSLDALSDSGLAPLSLPSPAHSSSASGGSALALEEGSMRTMSTMNTNPLALSLVDTDPLGPFLGTGSSPTSATFDPFDFPGSGSGSDAGFGVGSAKTGERRRVRIALRSLPQPGGEGGEWEVEVR